jgi:CRISPR-associated protein (TIGR03984 family)
MINQPSTTLYSYRSEAWMSLPEAIAHCGDVLKDAIALLYSPNACQFLRLISGTLQDSYGKSVNHLSDVFEARIFTEHCELRWLNRDRGKGDAVLLTEVKQSISGFQVCQQPIEGILDQQYLLWGKPVLNPNNIQDGWQRLAEVRIGKLNIPISERLNDKEQRVYLKTREYINALEYGNCAVIEERLLKLEVK